MKSHPGERLGHESMKVLKDELPLAVSHLSIVHIDVHIFTQVEKYKLYCPFPGPAIPFAEVLITVAISHQIRRIKRIPSSTLDPGLNA